MRSLAYISPATLCSKSLLAGGLFSVMVPLALLDLACIILRAIGYSWISAWSTNEDVLALLIRPPLQGGSPSSTAGRKWAWRET